MATDHTNVIEDREYLRKRLEPRAGDPDYIHLVDLLKCLEQYRTDEKIAVLDYGAGGSPYREFFPNSDYRRADFVDMSDLDYVIGSDSKVEETDSTFDLVLSTQVAEHVTDTHAYFSECARLLKSGGMLLCTTHGTYPDHGCPYDFQRWTADGLRRDLERAGFEVVGITKLTTNGRAIMYLMQRFSGWFESPNSGALSPVLRLYRSVLHRYPRLWHRFADRWFGSNSMVDATDIGHEFYLGLIATARRP
jgi:SAM-dependent methyltransferase